MVSEIAKETKVQHRILGKSWPRVDGLEKVTGTATYGVDMKLPGMLYGKVLRSPYPHAKIVKIDTSNARALSGIKAVLTADDIPQGKFGLAIRDQTILACEKVRFIAEPVAAVVAIDEELAEEALKIPVSKIRVIATKVGGGFGGKFSASIEPVCAVLSQRTNKPVKMVLDRTEEFTATFVRHPATIKIKTGVKFAEPPR